uniref:Glutathione S-transferase kappa 1 n=1 Tax=Ursus maritimus TaxID=29073 RepID=A0A452U508_URSMA
SGTPPGTVETFQQLMSADCVLQVLITYGNFWNISLKLHLSLAAAVMEDRNKPPSLLPHRALGQHVQVPIQFPEDFFSVILEKGSLSAMRFLTPVDLEMLEKVSRELWMCVWSWDEDILEPQTILAPAEKTGLFLEQAQTLLEKISTSKMKNKLKDTTEAACEYGAFVVPLTVAHQDGQTNMLLGSGVGTNWGLLEGKWMGVGVTG